MTQPLRRKAAAALSASLLSISLTTAAADASAENPAQHPAAPAGKPPASAPYLNAKLPISARVDDLLERMTVEEKVAQLLTLWHQRRQMEDSELKFVPAKAAQLMPHGIGHIGRPSEFKSARQAAEFNNALQRWLKQHTRLGIPAITHEEALHGYATFDATSFPQAIALASSWSPADLKQMYALVAREMRATGANWALTPVLDIGRDARWGRIEETMGEDPYLMSALGVASIEGFQGEPGKGTDWPFAADKVVATLKHLTGHGQPAAGVNIAPAAMGPRELREIFLPPFEAAVRLSQAASIMASYNEIDGVPSHVNGPLLNGIARGEWGFQGAVVSDYFAIQELSGRHQLFASERAAGVAALKAGVDMETPDPRAFKDLAGALKAGELTQAELDQAVRRVLTLKFRLGLFEQAEVDASLAEAQVGNAQGALLAQQLAEKAVVLLKNDGTLPLTRSKIKTLAVIGPHADETLLGGYSSIPRRTVPILTGLQQLLAGEVNVNFARGVYLTAPLPTASDQAAAVDATDTSTTAALQAKTAAELAKRSAAAQSWSMQRWNHDDIKLADPKQNQQLIAEAVALAKTADAVVLVLGENEGLSREAWAEQHLGDRTSLALVGEQQQLAQALLQVAREQQKPLVLVLQNGRPLALGALADQMPAILEAWYPGQQGGSAIARILFGEVNPSGKLPLTFPRSAGHIPTFYNHKPTAKRGYLFDDISPLYPFGHGLSYSTFSYSDLTIDAADAVAGGTVRISLTIKNTSARAGTEVIQLYTHDRLASLTRPVQELKGFARVALKAGEQKRLTFALPVNLLAFVDANLRWVVEPGAIDVMIGSSSADIRLRSEFAIQGQAPVDVSQARAFLTPVQVE